MGTPNGEGEVGECRTKPLGPCSLGSVGALNPEAWHWQRPQDVIQQMAQIRGLSKTT